MKKLIAILLMLTLCAAVFASCDDGKTNESSVPVSEGSVSAEESSAPADESSVSAEESEASTNPDEDTVMRIGGLKGPTSMGLVKLMQDSAEGKSGHNYEFTVEATADMITPLLIKGEIDMAAVPANLASILYNNTDGKIKVLAINTLGVLYIVEKNAGITSLADLRGKTLYATGKGSVPEYNLLYLLKEAGLDPEKDLTIEWKSEPKEIAALLKKAESGAAMLPQPYVTAAQAQVEGLKAAVDLNSEWEKLHNGSMMVTGVLVARADFLECHADLVNAFLDEYKASVDYINANPKEASVWVEQRIGIKAPIAEKAVPRCNLRFLAGTEMKAALSGYLKVLHDRNAKSVGGKLPPDEFYYGA